METVNKFSFTVHVNGGTAQIQPGPEPQTFEDHADAVLSLLLAVINKKIKENPEDLSAFVENINNMIMVNADLKEVASLYK